MFIVEEMKEGEEMNEGREGNGRKEKGKGRGRGREGKGREEKIVQGLAYLNFFKCQSLS